MISGYTYTIEWFLMDIFRKKSGILHQIKFDMHALNSYSG